MGLKEKTRETVEKFRRAVAQIMDSGKLIAAARARWEKLRPRAEGLTEFKQGEKILKGLESSYGRHRILAGKLKDKAKESGGDIGGVNGVGLVWLIPVAIMAGVALIATTAAHFYDKTINETRRLNQMAAKLSLVEEGKAPADILKEAKAAGGGGLGDIVGKLALGVAALLILPHAIGAARKKKA
jgi:hypothetical protein